MTIHTGSLEQGNVIQSSGIHNGGVQWSAVFAGGLAAAALTIILSVLGSGLGLTAVSPWSDSGISAAAFGVSAILWLSFTQIIASGLGGFLAGRLRVKWLNVHHDEIYFTDTAHGFLTWALALIVTVTLFASVLGSVVSGGAQSAAVLAKHVGHAASASKMDDQGSTQAYFLDGLFRRDTVTQEDTLLLAESKKSALPEIRRILMQSLAQGAVSPADAKYAAQLVAKSTGLSQEEAEQRVNAAYASISKAATEAKAAADKARKASAYVTLWGFIALLIGAFTASLAATWGGRCRDNPSYTST